MSDLKLRRAERAGDQAEVIRQRIRAGEVDVECVHYAAIIGSQLAADALHRDVGGPWKNLTWFLRDFIDLFGRPHTVGHPRLTALEGMIPVCRRYVSNMRIVPDVPEEAFRVSLECLGHCQNYLDEPTWETDRLVQTASMVYGYPTINGDFHGGTALIPVQHAMALACASNDPVAWQERMKWCLFYAGNQVADVEEIFRAGAVDHLLR